MRSRLFARLLSVVLLVLILPVAGLWSLGVFESELLVAEERTMAVTARALAAGLVCPLDSARGRELLARIERPLAGRVRIVDAEGNPLADTAGARRPQSGGVPATRLRDSWLYRLGAALWRPWQALTGAPARYGGGGDSGERAIADALAGGYGARTGESADGRTTVMTVAVPVRSTAGVCGAVAVSRTTESVLAALDRIRVDLFRIVLLSVLAAGLVVLLLARGLVRPMGRLRDAADAVLARTRTRGAEFPGAARKDEIGDLARALGGLDERLERRLDELEAFASDVAHEVKNPLAAMRSAAELLRTSTKESEIRDLTALIVSGVGRIDAIVGALQEVARLDAGREGTVAASPPPALRLDELATRVVAGWRERAPAGVALECVVDGPAIVAIREESAARVIDNLLENAVSFTGQDGTVRLTLVSREGQCELAVDDSGPGVPAEHARRIFERFFTWRPQESARSHLGLGLGIARAIVERHGGTIELASGSPLGGARFVVRWPVAPQRSGRYQ